MSTPEPKPPGRIQALRAAFAAQLDAPEPSRDPITVLVMSSPAAMASRAARKAKGPDTTPGP